MEYCRPRGAPHIDNWIRILEEDLLHPVHHNVLVTAWEDDTTRYRCCWCGDKILGVVCEVSVGRCAHFLCACLAKIHGAERRHWRRVRRHEHRQRWEASRSRKSKTASSYSIRGSRTALIHTRHIEQLQSRANFLRGGGFSDDVILPQADSMEHSDCKVCTVSRAYQLTWLSLMMCAREASGIFQPWAMEIAQSMLLLGISSMEVSGAENHASYSVVLSVRRLRRSKHLSAIRAWCSGSKRICGLTHTRFALEKNSGRMLMSRT